ncbi:MAG: AbrB/MazE/SpoVT family DNA-binding domain-containing protein, partial [Christensenellales bacterium]
MKDTGIARRVDQLGRIVLPMEIRKKLKIVEGTLLNLSLEDNCIKLEKYSPLLNFKEYAEDILKECEDFTYLICDDSNVILSNKSFKGCKGEQINSSSFEEIEDFVIRQNSFQITNDFCSEFAFNYIFAIKKDGDVFGYLVFAFDKEASAEVLG